MNNNNPNKNSPLDEIKRITKESSHTQNRRRGPINTNNPQRPNTSVPTQKSINTANNGYTAPTKKDYGINVPSVANSPSDPNEISRAEKVRLARENAQRVKEEALKTQVISNVSELSAADNDDLEKQRDEARRLVRENSMRYDNSQTIVTNKVPVNSVNRSQVQNTPNMQKKKVAKQSEMSKEFEETIGRGVLSNTVKAVIYIVSVFVLSGCLSLFAILVGNDCFAFVKNDAEVNITIPENATLKEIADVLHDNNIIKYPSMFRLYINIRGKDIDNYLSGEFTVNGMMSYDTLIAKFKPYETREEVTITIVEGATTKEIIELFVSQGIGTEEGFKEAINTYDYEFWFIEELSEEITSDRIYRLDGYLFPDTYNFYTDSSEVDIIYKLLSNFNNKFDKENVGRLKELGMSLDEIVTIASMIESEAKYVNNNPYAENNSDFALVSAVFHNRLNNPSYETNGCLDSDATVLYALEATEKDMELSDALKDYDTPYNTYLYAGLPAGPICSPSLNALNFAMNPDKSYGSDLYYFIANSQGYNLYAKTYSEHQSNINTVASEATD